MGVAWWQAAKATGQLTLQKVLDMQEAGVEVESFVSEDMRLQMYTKEVFPPSPCNFSRVHASMCSALEHCTLSMGFTLNVLVHEQKDTQRGIFMRHLHFVCILHHCTV